MASKAVTEVRGLIGAVVIVTISDGRRIEGQFDCVDKEKNIVLSRARQLGREGVPDTPLGNALVPGHHMVKTELVSMPEPAEPAVDEPTEGAAAGGSEVTAGAS